MSLKVSLRMNKLELRRMAERVKQHQRNQKRRRKKRNLPPLSREEGEVGEDLHPRTMYQGGLAARGFKY